MFQYFIQVVPTEVDTASKQVSTYQYSLTESVSVDIFTNAVSERRQFNLPKKIQTGIQ